MVKRILFFVYGSLCYLIVLGTFLYAIGFIGNFEVTKTLDGPLSGSLLSALATNAGLLALFAVQHSVMARKWFKESWTRLVPQPIERATYVLFSSLALTLSGSGGRWVARSGPSRTRLAESPCGGCSPSAGAWCWCQPS